MSELDLSAIPEVVMGNVLEIENIRRQAAESGDQDAAEAANKEALLSRLGYVAALAEELQLPPERNNEIAGAITSLGNHIGEIEEYIFEEGVPSASSEIVATQLEEIGDFVGGLIIAASSSGITIKAKFKGDFFWVAPEEKIDDVLQRWRNAVAKRSIRGPSRFRP